MLIVKQDKTRKEEEGQIFVELTIYRDRRLQPPRILVRQSASVALHHGMREMFYARRIKKHTENERKQYLHREKQPARCLQERQCR